MARILASLVLMRPWVASTQQTLTISQRLIKLIAVPRLQSSWRSRWRTRMMLRSRSSGQPALLLMENPFLLSILSSIPRSCQSIHVKWFMKVSLIAATLLQVLRLSFWGWKVEKERTRIMVAVSVHTYLCSSFLLRYDNLTGSVHLFPPH